MKICHVISSLDPRAGGPFSVVTGLAAAQAALDHEVWIITKPGLSPESRAARLEAPGLEKVSVSYIKTPPNAPISLVRHYGTMKKIISACDMVHLHGVWGPVIWTAATIARKTHTIYAVTPHGMLDPWSLSQKRWKKKLALTIGFRKMLERAAFLHLLNRDEEINIKPLSLACKRVIIPNGICPSDVMELPPRGEFYNTHPELDAKSFILFMGRLHYKKGLDYLVDAFSLVAKQHANVDLVIAGPDSGEQINVQRKIEQLQLNDRVHLVGSLYGRAKFAALTAATVFCLPSRQEGFSMSIIEALACRAPVVISAQCHFSEIAEAGAGEVVDLDPKAISAALGRLIRDKVLRDKSGEAGRALVFSRFTWPKIALQTAHAYVHALTGSNAGARKASTRPCVSHRESGTG